MLLIAHKTNRNTKMGLFGKPYAIGADGVLSPQPVNEDRRNILSMRWFHIIDVETAAEKAARLERLVPKPEPEPAPPAPPVAPSTPTLDLETAHVLAVTQALDAVVAADREPVEPISNTKFDQLPALPTADQLDDAAPVFTGFDYSSLSRDELYEIVKERGIPGCSSKTKAELLAIVMGT